MRSGVIALRNSASRASVLRGSRIARRYPAVVHELPVERWAKSGAMALTGLPDEALGPPAGLVEGVERLGRYFPGLDTLALLGERAALMGLWRRGATSCGGSCRLLPCADGFMAVSLPRDEDMEMVPAWLELDATPSSTPAAWSAVASALLQRDPGVLRERALLLGLPVARVGEAAPPGHAGARQRAAVIPARLGEAHPRPDVAGALVIDLSALWAGPLCGDLLAGVGATVVKVESTQRPDGARRGARAFYDVMNARKRSVALDLEAPQGVRILRELVRRADVVIEASRPRALAAIRPRCPGRGRGRRPPGLDLHHRIRPLGRKCPPHRVRRRRRGSRRARDPDRGWSSLLRRRHRRSAHGSHCGGSLRRQAPLGRTLALGRLHGRGQCWVCWRHASRSRRAHRRRAALPPRHEAGTGAGSRHGPCPRRARYRTLRLASRRPARCRGPTERRAKQPEAVSAPGQVLHLREVLQPVAAPFTTQP